MPLTKGKMFGPYEIRSQLGAGGMGEVWRAHDPRLARDIAIKVLPEEFSRDAERLSRFEREARAISALNHPNIVTIYEIGSCDGIRYIATEYIDGVTLRDRLLLRPVSLREAINIVTQIATALMAAHQAGIVHRDIKPENVMLRQDGYIKVLDFGLARVSRPVSLSNDSAALTLAPLRTDPGRIMGTINYMAPEQVRGRQVDARADIFSLGVILYELLAGQQPFSGGSGPDVLAAILERNPAPLAELTPGLPAELDWITDKALAKDCEDRYQTVKSFGSDLRRLQQRLDFEAENGRVQRSGSRSGDTGLASTTTDSVQPAPSITEGATPATVRQVSSAEYLLGEITRRRGLAPAILGALLLVILAGLYFLYREKPVESIAVLPFVMETTDEETRHLGEGLTTQLINGLIQLPGVRVKAYESVARYRGESTDFARIARELSVEALLVGRVGRRGSLLTLQITLLDPADSSQKWGKQYNYDFSGLLLAEQQVTHDVVENLRTTLRLHSGDEKRIAALALYQQGRFFWNQRTAAALQKARGFFELAVETDPQFALAHAGLADCYTMLATYNAMPPHMAFPKASEAARRALERDSQLAEAHGALALVAHLYEWDWATAEREFRRTIELRPDYAPAHQWYANFLATMGRTSEALAEARLAQGLDPLSRIIKAHQGRILYFVGAPEQSATQLQQVLAQDPGFFAARRYLGLTLSEMGRHAEAIAELKQALSYSEDSLLVRSELGYACAAAGLRDEARAIIGALRAAPGNNALSFQIAAIHAGLGEKDKAIEMLRRALDERSDRLPYLGIDPRFRQMRTHSEYISLLAHLNIPTAVTPGPDGQRQ
ncbi:MAG: protein kinase domain-containing protein [Blastocatellia bacterium]